MRILREATMDLINLTKIVNNISGMLEIAPPKISFNTSLFPTPTTLAMVDCANNVLYIKSNTKSELDLIFATAHELRHLWQHLNNERFDDYKHSDELSVEAYNLQPAEIDANAYAALMMMSQLGVKPQWHGLSDKVIKAINNRINEIADGK